MHFRRWAIKLYRGSSIQSADDRMAFDPSTANTISDHEEFNTNSNGYLIGYTLKRVAQNPTGEYFWFRINSDSKPPLMAKHLEKKIAKTLLKDKFVDLRKA